MNVLFLTYTIVLCLTAVNKNLMVRQKLILNNLI